MRAVLSNSLNRMYVLVAILTAIALSCSILKFGWLIIGAVTALVAIMTFSFNRPLNALYIYIFFLPFFPSYLGADFGPFGILHCTRILNIIFLIPIIMRAFFEKRLVCKKTIIYDILVFGFIVLSSIYSFINDGFLVGKGLLYHEIIDFFVLYLAITRSVINKSDFMLVNDVLIMSGLFFTVIGLVDYWSNFGFYTNFMQKFFSDVVLFVNEYFRSGMVRMQISFGQPLALGVYIAILHMIIICTYEQSMVLSKKLIYLIAFGSSMLCLILSQARGPLLIDLALIIIYLFFVRQIRRFIFITILLIFIIGLVFYALGIPVKLQFIDEIWFYNVYMLNNAQFRIDLYNDVLLKIRHVSFIGEHQDYIMLLQNRFKIDTVVWYVQILVFSGSLTLIIFLSLLIKVIIDYARKCFHRTVPYLHGYFFAFLALLISFLAVSFVGHIKFYFWVIISMCISIIAHEDNTQRMQYV